MLLLDFFTSHLAPIAAICQPANNDCLDSVPLQLGANDASTVGGSRDGGVSSICAQISSTGSDAWWTLTSQCDGTIAIDSCTSSFDTVLEVYQGHVCTPGDAFLITCSDDDDVCIGDNVRGSRVSFPAVPNQQFLVRLGGFGAERGTASLLVSCNGQTPPPGTPAPTSVAPTPAPTSAAPSAAPTPALPNDRCSDALPVQDGPTVVTFVGATLDGPADVGLCSSGNVGSDVWFQYTSSCTGELRVDTCDSVLSSSVDTVLAVYKGGMDCSAVQQAASVLACNDDTPACPSSFLSAVSEQTVAGNQHLIRLGGFSSNQGVATLKIECVAAETASPTATPTSAPTAAPATNGVCFRPEKLGVNAGARLNAEGDLLYSANLPECPQPISDWWYIVPSTCDDMIEIVAPGAVIEVNVAGQGCSAGSSSRLGCAMDSFTFASGRGHQHLVRIGAVQDPQQIVINASCVTSTLSPTAAPSAAPTSAPPTATCLVTGGVITTSQANEKVCREDGLPDFRTFNIFESQSSENKFIWLLTDVTGTVLRVIERPATQLSIELDVDPGIVRGDHIGLFHIAYTGDLLITPGQNVPLDKVSSGCYQPAANIIIMNLDFCGTAAPTSSPTVSPSTSASPTSLAPTTESPTTNSPTSASDAPTTDAPTTHSPTTEMPTTGSPTTAPPTTDSPSAAPSSGAPSPQPTTDMPTAAIVSTSSPSEAPTLAPSPLETCCCLLQGENTCRQQYWKVLCTLQRGTCITPSVAPTPVPSTVAPTAPTAQPSSGRPTQTPAPSTTGTPQPSTSTPTSSAPTAIVVTSAPTSTTSPPSTNAPTTINSTTGSPTTNSPTSPAPTTNNPSTTSPTSPAPTTNNPTTNSPTSPAPSTIRPTTFAPSSSTSPTSATPTVSSAPTLPPSDTIRLAFESALTVDQRAMAVAELGSRMGAAVTEVDSPFDDLLFFTIPGEVNQFVIQSALIQISLSRSLGANLPRVSTVTVATPPPPTASAVPTHAPTPAPSASPTTASPTTASPSRVPTPSPTSSRAPSSAPTPSPTGEPTAVATTPGPSLAPTPAPTSATPTTLEPTTLEPTTLEPTTLEPTTLEPTTSEPTTSEPTTESPTTSAPSSAGETTLPPSSAQPFTTPPDVPSSAGQHGLWMSALLILSLVITIY